MGSVATQAARYPPSLVAGLLKGIRDERHENGELSAIQAFASGPNPNQENWAEWSDEVWDDVTKFFDNVS